MALSSRWSESWRVLAYSAAAALAFVALERIEFALLDLAGADRVLALTRSKADDDRLAAEARDLAARSRSAARDAAVGPSFRRVLARLRSRLGEPVRRLVRDVGSAHAGEGGGDRRCAPRDRPRAGAPHRHRRCRGRRIAVANAHRLRSPAGTLRGRRERPGRTRRSAPHADPPPPVPVRRDRRQRRGEGAGQPRRAERRAGRPDPPPRDARRRRACRLASPRRRPPQGACRRSCSIGIASRSKA